MASRTVTFLLTDDDLAHLRALAARRGTSMTHALRRAIATEVYLDGQIRSGSKLLLEKADGTLREVIVLG